jgi:hypothetical protein
MNKIPMEDALLNDDCQIEESDYCLMPSNIVGLATKDGEHITT